MRTSRYSSLVGFSVTSQRKKRMITPGIIAHFGAKPNMINPDFLDSLTTDGASSAHKGLEIPDWGK